MVREKKSGGQTPFRTAAAAPPATEPRQPREMSVDDVTSLRSSFEVGWQRDRKKFCRVDTLSQKFPIHLKYAALSHN